jgi:hypothetical protein
MTLQSLIPAFTFSGGGLLPAVADAFFLSTGGLLKHRQS